MIIKTITKLKIHTAVREDSIPAAEALKEIEEEEGFQIMHAICKEIW